MSDKAQQRINAIGNQLSAASGLPAIHRVAPGSSAPRVKGKVVIITGKMHFLITPAHVPY